MAMEERKAYVRTEPTTNRLSFLFRRLLLRWVLGKSAYNYMCRSLAYDPRLRNCRAVDIIIRKDGLERRIEADWLKKLRKIVAVDLVWLDTYNSCVSWPKTARDLEREQP